METKKCPVCEWEIPGPPSGSGKAGKDGGIKVTVGGKEITVCCDDCAEKAKKSPEKYAA